MTVDEAFYLESHDARIDSAVETAAAGDARSPIAEWAWTRLAGRRPTRPGWSTFDVAPSLTPGSRR